MTDFTSVGFKNATLPLQTPKHILRLRSYQKKMEASVYKFGIG